MKNRIKKASIILSWILIVSMIVSLGAVAYFSYETEDEHASFKMANLSIEASATMEAKAPGSHLNQNGHYLNLQESTKGGEIPYEMTITNTSDSEAILYSVVMAPVYEPKSSFSSAEEDVYSFFDASLNDNWSLIYADTWITTEGRHITYYYYGYLKPVLPGETIEGPLNYLTYNPASIQYNSDLYPVNNETKYTYMPISIAAFGTQSQDHGFNTHPDPDDEYDLIDVVPNSWDFVNYLVLNLETMKDREQLYSYFIFRDKYYDYLMEKEKS